MKVARLVFGLALLLIANSAFGQKVTTDSMPGTDWSKYHTFSWGEGTPVQDPLLAQKIVAEIESQLTAKGFKKVDSDPDLVVLYHTTTGEQKSLNWSNMGGWGRFGGMGSAQVDTVITGQLKVDIGDAKEKKFLWRGTAAGTVSSDPQKLEKTLNKSVAKMFQKFPPTTAK